MAQYYISQSSGNNANAGTSDALPFKTFKALTANDFLSPGDEVNLFTNDEWIAGEVACDIQSAGSNGNYITFQAYGTGSNPLLTCSPLYSAGWTLTSGAIYIADSSYAATVSVVGIARTDALCRAGSFAAMSAGTFFYSASADRVYAWLSDSSDPNSTDTYIGVTNTFRVKDAGSGNYIKYNNLDMRYANGIGWRATGTNVEFSGCKAFGNGREGFHFSRNGVSAPGAQYGIAYQCSSILCSAGNDGSGSGQAFTSEAADVTFEKCVAKDCFMAGFDFLDFNASTDVSRNKALWCVADNCGQWIQSTFGDPGFYIDGANNTLIYGCISHGNGTGRNAAAGLFLDGFQISNETPVDKTCTGNSIINSLSYNNTGYCFRVTCGDTSDTTDDTTIVNCTGTQGPSPAFTCMTFTRIGGTGITFENNILRSSNSRLFRFITGSNAALFTADNNCYWRNSGTDIFDVDSVDYTLAEWQTLEGEDANSVFGDPQLVSVTASTYDAHLVGTSSAINLANTAGWLGSPAVRGVSLAIGGYENPGKNAGFYYDSETVPGTGGDDSEFLYTQGWI